MAWTDAIMGGLGGAGTGAAIGSIFGPIGTGVGAGIGALLGGGSSYAASSGGGRSGGSGRNRRGGSTGGGTANMDSSGGLPEKTVRIPVYDPWQAALMQRFGPMGGQGLESILNERPNQFPGYQGLQQLAAQPFDTQAMEAEAMRQYNQQIVPDIMQRIIGSQPTAQLQRSSAFGQQLGQAGTDLATRLADLRARVGMQNQQFRGNIYSNMLGAEQANQGMRGNIYGSMMNAGMQPMYNTVYSPAQQAPYRPGFVDSIMPAVGAGIGGLGQGFGQYLGSKWAGGNNQGGGNQTGSGLNYNFDPASMPTPNLSFTNPYGPSYVH